MSVSGINAVAFTGRTAKTKQGNEYKRSLIGINSGIILPTIGTAVYDLYKSKGLKNCINIAKVDPAKLQTFNLKTTIITTVAGIAVGAIADLFINKARAKNADKPVMLK